MKVKKGKRKELRFVQISSAARPDDTLALHGLTKDGRVYCLVGEVAGTAVWHPVSMVEVLRG